MSFDKPLFDYVLNAAKEFEDGLETNPVVPTKEAIENLAVFDEPLPIAKTDPIDVLKMLHEVGTPATTLSRSGRFFGFVVGGTLPVSLASNWLTSTWDQNAALTMLGYTAAKLEQVSRAWILELLDLPPSAGMGFVTGATMAGFTSLSVARNSIYKKLSYDLQKSGLRNAPDIRFIVSEDIHATNIRALNYLGYGTDELEFVPVDEEGRIIVEKIPELGENCILLIQAGNINSGA
ncbi:MAG: aspartate aminotransferase family protein, partial [Kordiimonadaceae bacterium]|nr:aspartate aminotransferase family protein [Kordiimonadaceae bacterium]